MSAGDTSSFVYGCYVLLVFRFKLNLPAASAKRYLSLNGIEIDIFIMSHAARLINLSSLSSFTSYILNLQF